MGELKTKYGTIYLPVAKKNEQAHAEFMFEKEFIKILETQEYDMFVDVGAGWGYHALVAAHNTAHVYAFEPHPKRNKILQDNVGKFGNVSIFSLAVGTGDEEVYLNSMSSRGMIGPKTGIRIHKADVGWVSLDTIFSWNPFFDKAIIKIDTEGNELDVIESGKDIKHLDNIIWMIERHQKKDLGYSEEELFKSMQPLKGKLVGTRKWTSHYIFKMEN